MASAPALAMITIVVLFFILALLSVTQMSSPKVSTFQNSSSIVSPLCTKYPPADAKNTSCWDYLSTCYPKYFKDKIQTDNAKDTMRRRFVLERSKLAVEAGGDSLQGCSMQYPYYQMFELTDSCPDGSKFHSKELGCVTKFTFKYDDKTKVTNIDNDSNLPKFSMEAYKRMSDGSSAPSDKLYPNTRLEPKIPNRDVFPELQSIMNDYEAYYRKKLGEFMIAPLRCGYVVGPIYDKKEQKEKKEDNKKGADQGVSGGGKDAHKNKLTPIIQKRFGHRYYTLLYKYTTEAFKNIGIDNLADWFSTDLQDQEDMQKMELSTDPNTTYESIEKFLSDQMMQYRSQYLVDIMKNNKSRYYVIVEVGNKYNEEPILRLQLCKYSTDMEDKDHVDLMKFFGKGRLMPEYTSNKRLIEEQFGLTTFKIDSGQDYAWTIGYTSSNKCKDHYVFMTIPTGKSCPWQGWFRGNIVVSNEGPINIAGTIDNFDAFKKKNVGQWMNVWVCAENGDPFQDILMTPGIINFNPHMFQNIFVRRPNQIDESWALFIWKTISGEEDSAIHSDAFKRLLEVVKGKNTLDFKEYSIACNAALKGVQTKKAAHAIGCLGTPPKVIPVPVPTAQVPLDATPQVALIESINSMPPAPFFELGPAPTTFSSS